MTPCMPAIWRMIAVLAVPAMLHGQNLPPAPAKSPVAPQLQQHERYRIHPGDVLVLSYRFTPDFNQTAIVEPDGYVALNLVGRIRVAGLSMDQTHDLIVQGASDRLNAPELTLSLKEFVAPYIVVSGEVAKPGKLELREGTTALQSIQLAGGFGENARAGQVIVIRRVNDVEGEVHLLNLARIHTNKDLERDMALQAGDMVVVPRDRISQISRYIKLSNVGVYFNPLDPITR